MDYNGIWEDCIDKMDDLGCNIDELSATVLPKLSLSQDPIVGPLILSIMNDVIDLEQKDAQIQTLENRLEGGHLMYVEYSVDDYLSFAFQRGLESQECLKYSFLKYGDDDTLNMLMAIDFLLEELQLNRILFYRRSHAKQSILSPNRNIEGLKQRVREDEMDHGQVRDLAFQVTESKAEESAIQDIYTFCEVVLWLCHQCSISILIYWIVHYTLRKILRNQPSIISFVILFITTKRS